MTNLQLAFPSHLAALVGFVVIPGWVFLRDPSREANQSFALLGLSGAFFNACCLVALGTPEGPARLVWNERAFLGAFLLLPLLVRFPTAFLGAELCPDRPRLRGATWGMVLGLSGVVLTGGFLPGSDPAGRPVGGVMLALWTVLIGAAFVDFSLVLRRGYLHQRTPELKNRLLYLVLGAVLFAMPACSDLIHRLGGDLGQPFPLAPLGSLAFLACLGVAVVRHRLLDIEVVVHRGLVLSLLAPSLALSFVVLGEVLESLFAGTLPPGSPYPGILAALGVAFLLGPLTELLSRLVELCLLPEFRAAPGLRRFRHLPYLIGAEDVEGLRSLQGELDEIVRAIESKKSRSRVPRVEPTRLVPAAAPRRRGERRKRRRRKKR